MTFIKFLSEMGGIFGLCLGCSLISGLEVVYWLGFKMFFAKAAPRKREKRMRINKWRIEDRTEREIID